MSKLFITGAAFYLILLIMVYYYQKNLLFFPDQTSLKVCPEIISSGGKVHDEGLERLYIIRTTHQTPRGWVLHFHGNAGRACDRFSINREFLELGYNLVLSEYPGYSESAPLPSEEEILRAAEGSYDYLSKVNETNLPVILYGESLGTGPATFLASKDLKNISALILQTPYPSLASVGQSHYFYLPVHILLSHKFNAKKWAKEVKVPVFIFHGNQDEVIPFKLGKEQSKNFSENLVTFWEVPGAHHNDLLMVTGSELWERMKTFLPRGH